MTTWRDRIAPLVAAVLQDTQHLTLKEKRKRLREAKPHWVASASWMTKVWLSECQYQLGLKSRHKPRTKRDPGPGQKELFE